MNQKYKKAVEEALEAVSDVKDQDLKKIGFETVLKSLLEGGSGHSPLTVFPHGGESKNVVQEVIRPVTNKTGLSEEELNVLFEVAGGALVLKVKPTGDSLAKKQQALAHAVLVGYHALLGKDSVPSLTMVSIARSWNLMDRNFATSVRTPGYVQSKGVKKAAVYSLRPGALDKLKDSMQKMARGE